MSRNTVAQSIFEGGVMANIQLGLEISKTDSLIVSSDIKMLTINQDI